MSLDSKTNEPVWLLPFTYMGVGQSFFIPTLRPSNMIYVIDTRAKEDGIRIKAYVTMKDGFLGVRVWRIG
jgi:hypothetical protein